jgi:hypothetical protein
MEVKACLLKARGKTLTTKEKREQFLGKKRSGSKKLPINIKIESL